MNENKQPMTEALAIPDVIGNKWEKPEPEWKTKVKAAGRLVGIGGKSKATLEEIAQTGKPADIIPTYYNQKQESGKDALIDRHFKDKVLPRLEQAKAQLSDPNITRDEYVSIVNFIASYGEFANPLYEPRSGNPSMRPEAIARMRNALDNNESFAFPQYNPEDTNLDVERIESNSHVLGLTNVNNRESETQTTDVLGNRHTYKRTRLDNDRFDPQFKGEGSYARNLPGNRMSIVRSQEGNTWTANVVDNFSQN